MQNRIRFLLFILVTTFSGTSDAQLLPKLEGDLPVSDEIGPKLLVWERDDISHVCVTVAIRFDPSDVKRYGARLPALLAALWEEAIPRTTAIDAMGITFLQVRDSILLQLHDQDSAQTPTQKYTKLLLDYRAREQLLIEKLRNQTGSYPVGIVAEPVVVMPNALLLRYRIQPEAMDNFFFQLRELAVAPLWLSEWEWVKRIEQGFPDRKRIASVVVPVMNSESQISEPLPMVPGSLAEYWSVPMQNAEWSVAMVGNVPATETIALSNLYWSSWELSAPAVSAYDFAQPQVISTQPGWRRVTMPEENRDVVRAFLLGGITCSHSENLAFQIASNHTIEIPAYSLSPTIPVEERRARWSQRLRSDLDLPETSADRLAIAQLQEGWKRWYIVDDILSALTDTPEQVWVKELQRQAESSR